VPSADRFEHIPPPKGDSCQTIKCHLCILVSAISPAMCPLQISRGCLPTAASDPLPKLGPLPIAELGPRRDRRNLGSGCGNCRHGDRHGLSHTGYSAWSDWKCSSFFRCSIATVWQVKAWTGTTSDSGEARSHGRVRAPDPTVCFNGASLADLGAAGTLGGDIAGSPGWWGHLKDGAYASVCQAFCAGAACRITR
jgi:hypothetical protein